MFFNDLNKPKRVKPRLFNDFAQGILFSVLAVICFVFYRREWWLALLFAMCAAFRFWHHSKMEKNKIALKKITSEYDDDDFEDEDDVSTFSRKERKARYKAHLNEIEDDFPDIDLEDDEYADVEDSDENY